MSQYRMLHRVLAAPPEPIREIDEQSIELTYWLSPLFSPRELTQIQEKVFIELTRVVPDASIYVEVKRGIDEAIIAHLHFKTPRPFTGLNEIFRKTCRKVLEGFLLQEEPRRFN
jgi:hypothetical protein